MPFLDGVADSAPLDILFAVCKRYFFGDNGIAILEISCKIEGFTLDEKREVRSAARGNGARQRIYVIINLSSLSGYAIRNRIIGEATLLSKGAETNETI